MPNDSIGRRSIIKAAITAAAGLASGVAAAKTDAGATCKVTPEQTAGPFYPTQDQADKDTDLTRVEGRDGKAEGEILFVRGVVTDENCVPIPDALVEIWQANHFGRYRHERDNSSAKLDPHFQGWGQCTTNDAGEYHFKTIKPAPYGVGNAMRTPHIHFKVARRGYEELTTQMYFEGEELNPDDFVYRRLSEDEQKRVTITPEKHPTDDEPEAKLCTFDVVLEKLA